MGRSSPAIATYWIRVASPPHFIAGTLSAMKMIAIRGDHKRMSGLVGQTLKHFHVMEVVGRGGMATVYKAWDLESAAVVAVKVLSPFLSAEEKFRTRFRREAKILHRLRHPHILPLLDYGEFEELLFIVMPFVSEGNLGDRMKRETIKVDDAARIIEQMADALQNAHDHGVVHRDIKPSNILLDEEYNARLSDFGFARVQEASVSLTGSTLLGTPAYMAPEQILGHEVTPRADQYALGVILYQLSTGKLPFEADTPMGLALQHATEPLPRPRRVNPNLPDAVEEVILRSLSKDPNFRYHSMWAFNRAFQDSLQAVIDPSTGRLKPEAVGAVPDASIAERTPVEIHPLPTAPARRRRIRPLAILGVSLLVISLGALAWFATRSFRTLQQSPADAVAMLPGSPVDLDATRDALVLAISGQMDAPIVAGELDTAVAGTMAVLLQDGSASPNENHVKTLDGTETPSPISSSSPERPRPSSTVSPSGGASAITSSLSPTDMIGPSPTLGTTSVTSSPTATVSRTVSLTSTSSPAPSATEVPVDPCSLIGLDGFSSGGKNVSWTLTNGNADATLLTTIDITWPGSNGGLFKVDLAGGTIWVGDDDAPSASLDNWIGGSTGRMVAGSESLGFRFQDTAAASGYSISVGFENGCTASANR